jgi:hypothetical protein
MNRRRTRMRSADVSEPRHHGHSREVVKEDDDKPVFFDTREKATFYAKARAAMDGGAVVKLENWFGDTENLSEVPPPTGRHLAQLRRELLDLVVQT